MDRPARACVLLPLDAAILLHSAVDFGFTTRKMAIGNHYLCVLCVYFTLVLELYMLILILIADFHTAVTAPDGRHRVMIASTLANGDVNWA